MAVKSKGPKRLVFTLNRDLIPWVLEVAQIFKTKPNAMANAIIDSVREAVESPNPQAPVRIVEICRRARRGAANLDETLLTRLLAKTMALAYPDLGPLEERYHVQLLSRVSEHMDEHGQMPDASTMQLIQEEIGNENVRLAREVREKRKHARQKARQKTSGGPAVADTAAARRPRPDSRPRVTDLDEMPS